MSRTAAFYLNELLEEQHKNEILEAENKKLLKKLDDYEKLKVQYKQLRKLKNSEVAE